MLIFDKSHIIFDQYNFRPSLLPFCAYGPWYLTINKWAHTSCSVLIVQSEKSSMMISVARVCRGKILGSSKLPSQALF